MNGRVASPKSVESDPKRSCGVLFCCDACHRPAPDLLYSVRDLGLGGKAL
jgi:hypothetical protein